METTPCTVFFYFYLGFIWLYVFTYLKPNWICDMFGDIEKVVTAIIIDLFVSIEIILEQTFELIFESLRPTLTNSIYSFEKLLSRFLKKINNEIPYFSTLSESDMIDLLIITLDNFFFYPVNKIYVELIKEALIIMSIFIPMFAWIKSKISFIRCLKECHKKIWQW